MLCNDELYRPQIEALRDLVDPMVLTVAEASMAESATVILQQAPPHFLLVGTSYGGSLALEVVARAPSRVVGLWLMGCRPGPHELSSEVVDERERRRTLLGKLSSQTPRPRWQPGERYATHVEGYHHEVGRGRG